MNEKKKAKQGSQLENAEWIALEGLCNVARFRLEELIDATLLGNQTDVKTAQLQSILDDILNGKQRCLNVASEP